MEERWQTTFCFFLHIEVAKDCHRGAVCYEWQLQVIIQSFRLSIIVILIAVFMLVNGFFKYPIWQPSRFNYLCPAKLNAQICAKEVRSNFYRFISLFHMLVHHIYFLKIFWKTAMRAQKIPKLLSICFGMLFFGHIEFFIYWIKFRFLHG